MTAQSSASTTLPKRSLWIINPWRDLLLFVATPAVILPVFLLAGSRFDIEHIALFVLAFGQIGHQLPGLLRAYGDRELFRQHKVRFLIAPLALLGVSALFIAQSFHGLVLVAVVWGVWHVLMQTYGLLRIYDSKTHSTGPRTRRLDLAMCVLWFGAAILLSRGRLVMILDLFFQSGGPLRAASLVRPLTAVWVTATLLVTALFLLNLLQSWRRGERPNPVKLALLLTSIGFFWFTSVSISNVILGLVMFEVFHDVQYFAIVWVFNRNRVQQSGDVGGFTKFLFRRSGALIGLYVGLIFAYGSLHLIEQWTTSAQLRQALTALLATSGLLHYYYDGFIWKLRDRSTRASLQLASENVVRRKPAVVGRSKHLVKWAGFAVPALWLFAAEANGPAPKLERYQALRTAVPASVLVRLELGAEYHQRGALDRAAAEYRAAIEIEPENEKAHNNLGLVLVARGETQAGIESFRTSLRINPAQVETRNNLGNALAGDGQFDAAIEMFEKLLDTDPGNMAAHNNLATTLARAGRYQEAEGHLHLAIRIDPNYFDAYYNLGTLFAQQKDWATAERYYRAALDLQPEHAGARRKLAIIKRIRAAPQSQAP